ncbi:MAG: hypothetical protein KF900_07185 [Bacteroidetes bacterium]|nr:hypothetical protein [Bacteroidota bacterium]
MKSSKLVQIGKLLQMLPELESIAGITGDYSVFEQNKEISDKLEIVLEKLESMFVGGLTEQEQILFNRYLVKNNHGTQTKIANISRLFTEYYPKWQPEKLAPPQQQNQTEQLTIPDNILQALADKGILQALADKSFIEKTTDSPLKWLKTKSLLAYFVDVANEVLKLKDGKNLQIAPFENLFVVKDKKTNGFVNVEARKISLSISERKNDKRGLPKGYKIIDEILKYEKPKPKTK